MASNRRGWEGNAAALVARTNKVFAREKAYALQLNERVLRDYVQRGIVARPARRGKTAIYGARHLEQVIAARRLVADGWPLGKIAEQRTVPGAKPASGAGLSEDAAPYAAGTGGRMNTLTVTSKGELTLPRAMVEALGARPGEKVSVEECPGGRVQLRRAPAGDISAFFGMLKHRRGRKPVTIEDMNRVIALGWAGKLSPPKK